MTNSGLSQPRYDGMAMVLHWVVAALILVVGGLGLLFDAIPRAGRPFWINMHAVIGLLMFGLVLLRILWRLSHPAPEPEAGWSRPIVLASKFTHLGLYALLIIIPLVGIVAYVWHGRVFDFGLFKLAFGVASQKGIYEPAEEVHGALAYLLMAGVGLHILGALWHQFVAKDEILARMLPLRRRGLEKP